MMTIKELTERINEGIDAPYQRNANRAFIERIHAQLKDGGVWGWPAGGEIYRKAGEGFERVDA
jgi:hypothetical protein